MTRPRGWAAGWAGRLWLRLVVAFVGVALAAIGVLAILSAVGTSGTINRFVAQQERNLTRAVAAGAIAAYQPFGWRDADLHPIFGLVEREGAVAQVRDNAGNVIRASPGFARLAGDPGFREPVVVRGRRVGTVTVKFDARGLGAAVGKFEADRWRDRATAAGIAALLAVVLALALSRQITVPVDRLIRAVRARAGGDRAARAQNVCAPGEICELSTAFDQMADAADKQDLLHRNLVADVAHELRTPVAVLLAGHEAMLDGVTEPTQENIASLREEVVRLGRMVADLQRLSAAESAALQLMVAPHDLAAIAAEAAASLGDSFDSGGVSLTLRLTEVQAICDPDRMHEVVTNLLTNALKFTPAGGSVALEAGPDGKDRAMLRVRDTGIGIPPDELPRVTERFFRGDRSGEVAAGSGIGLTIVDELVRGHHGDLEITSEPGRGTQVTILLPR